MSLLSDFQAGAGGIGADDLRQAIAAVLAVLLLTWTAWVAYAQCRAWADRQRGLFALLWTVIRATLVLLLLGFIVH